MFLCLLCFLSPLHPRPVPHPSCTWAQRPKHIILTICLIDTKDPVITVEKKKMHFKGVGGTEMKEHEVTFEFFNEIDPEKSKFAVRPREVSTMVHQTTSSPAQLILLTSPTLTTTHMTTNQP